MVPVQSAAATAGVGRSDREQFPLGRRATDGIRGELVSVGLDRVDLPRLLAGAVHPHLVLHRVATGGVVLLQVASPSPASRVVAAVTSSVVATSTPRWSSTVARSGSPSMSTSFNGGSAIAKFAYPAAAWPAVAPQM